MSLEYEATARRCSNWLSTKIGNRAKQLATVCLIREISQTAFKRRYLHIFLANVIGVFSQNVKVTTVIAPCLVIVERNTENKQNDLEENAKTIRSYKKTTVRGFKPLFHLRL